jgi:hypothetical protein
MSGILYFPFIEDPPERLKLLATIQLRPSALLKPSQPHSYVP